jgi:hypothetical protein
LTRQKEKKTAKELADMIKQRLGREVFLSVNKDPAYGWHPTVISSPGVAHQLQDQAEEIAKELRAQYELKED